MFPTLFPYGVKNLINNVKTTSLLTEYERFAVNNNFKSGVANFEEQILLLFLYPESLTEIIVIRSVNSLSCLVK